MGAIDHVEEAIGPETANFEALCRKRQRYPGELQTTRGKHCKHENAEETKDGGFIDRLHRYIARYFVVDEKIRTVSGDAENNEVSS